MARILVIDDERKLANLVAEGLSIAGHAVTQATGGRQGLVELAAQTFDLVLVDLRMPEVDGLQVLSAARAAAVQDAPDVIVMTAHGTTESAVAAMKAGAADYLIKPFALDELRLRVQRLVTERASRERATRLVERLTPSLVAGSDAMRQVFASARQVAATDATVLLLGETGTGKSELARLIHYESKRATRPLVEVHCSALAESLLEAELFGHERGAFTGADQAHAGHLEAADGGTLFLDEIGEVTASTQVKLLRFLQSREFVRVGSTQSKKVDVRVISATNRDLAAAIAAGELREDLYYRLNVFAIEIPPLRERRDDVLPLVRHLLARRGLPETKLGADAAQWLPAQSWPGNVRELENALERALILAGDLPLSPDHFRTPAARKLQGSSLADLLSEGFSLDTFERDLIYAALERAGGNKTAAAKLLGITRRRLYSRLESLGEKPGED
jgi:two-component system, NtrC family, response regulator HydG